MHGMTVYFIRRLMFIPITFVVITLLVYCVLRETPGGPIEQLEAALQQAAASGEGGAGAAEMTGPIKLTEAQRKELMAYYQLDRTLLVGYMVWLGVWPRDAEYEGWQLWAVILLVGLVATIGGLLILMAGRWRAGLIGLVVGLLLLVGAPMVLDVPLGGILQGDFGRSTTQGDLVLDVIPQKFNVSVVLGLIGFFGAYSVCIPLGVMKGIHHRSGFDTATSVIVFVGYSIPGFVLCILMLLVLATDNYGLQLLPLGGWEPPNAQNMGWAEYGWEKIQRMIIPISGYMIGSFATLTILMKNSLLENLGADYVRTAFAKGLPEKRVIFVHALRNSLIPITAGIGNVLGLLFAGSFLIEKVCNIPGMGLLGYESIIQRDYSVTMGVLVFTSLIGLTGNIISDLIWALIDPRIRFGSK